MDDRKYSADLNMSDRLFLFRTLYIQITQNYIVMKTKIYNLIILDASGSMHSIKTQTIDGFNETIQTIKDAQRKHEDQEHLVSLVVFNSSKIDTVYERIPASDVTELNEKTYIPDCSTPLYDAMGYSLNALRNNIGNDDRVLVTIITDGYENSSKEYSGAAVKSLVDELKSMGWVFTYIGANQDVEKAAAQISINNVVNFTATEVGTTTMFAREKKARLKFFDRLANNGNQVNECMNKDYFKED